MNKSTDHIGSLAKGLRVLACFQADTPKLTIAQVASETGLDRATSRRCLLTLHTEGYADYDGKFFTLTPRALRLGLGALASLPLPRLVQPWLDQLTDQIGQSCSVSILDHSEIVYVARAAQSRVMSIGLMPGSRLPAHCTSMGRVLLGALPAEEARDIIMHSDLSPRTAFSLTDPDEIMVQIALIKEQGFALIDQEIEIGLRALAVPIFDAGNNMVAALNTGVAATEDDPKDMIKHYLGALQRVQTGLRRII